MKRANHLYPVIHDFQNLRMAARKASKGKRHKPEVQEFLYNLEYELIDIQQDLQEKRYEPSPYRTFVIHDPKQRTIAAAPFRDRVVHHAICRVIGPCLERSFLPDSYACREGKGTHRAILRAQEYARRFQYYVKCDIRKYFDSIDQGVLMSILRRKFKDPELLWLLGRILETWPVCEDEGEADHPRKGVPIGNLTSQYFANLYLDPVDHLMKDRLGLPGYIRYMDDILLLAHDKESLHEAASTMLRFIEAELGLELKTFYLKPTWEGIRFLGFHIFPGMIRLQRQNWNRFKRKFLLRQNQYAQGKIDPEYFVQSIAGLFGHIQHGDTWNLRRRFLEKYEMDF